MPLVGICAGVNHTAALRDDGVVEAWGSIDFGNRNWSICDFGQAPQEKRAAVGRFMVISARDHHSTASHDGFPSGCDEDGPAPPRKRQRLS